MAPSAINGDDTVIAGLDGANSPPEGVVLPPKNIRGRSYPYMLFQNSMLIIIVQHSLREPQVMWHETAYHLKVLNTITSC